MGCREGRALRFECRRREGRSWNFRCRRWSLPVRGLHFGGGAYLRLLPYWYTRWGIRFLNEREGQPACVYVHPWEIDPEQPRMKGSVTARVRHYLGLRGLETKLRGLLRDFNFQTMGALIGEMEQESSSNAEHLLPEIPLAQLEKIADEVSAH